MKRQMHPCCACLLFHLEIYELLPNCWVYCLLSWFFWQFWGEQQEEGRCGIPTSGPDSSDRAAMPCTVYRKAA